MKNLKSLRLFAGCLCAGLLVAGLVLPGAAQDPDELDWLLDAEEPSEPEDLDWLAEPADWEEPEVTQEPDSQVEPGVLVEPDLPEDVVDFSEGPVDPGARIERRVVEGTEQITITLDDVLLEDAVRLFAQTSGANIIASGAMLADKRVTVNLTDVDWRPALRSILEIHDLDMVERTAGSGIYSIRGRVADAPAPSQVQTFFLSYTTVTEVQDAITAMLSGDAKLTTFASRNALVVRSTESNLSEIEALIEKLDRPGRQVLIEARIMELDDAAVKQLGIRWDSLEAFSIRAGAGPFDWLDTTERTRTRTATDQYWDRETSERLFDHRGREYSRLDAPQQIEQPGTTQYERFQNPAVPGRPEYILNPNTGQFDLYQPPAMRGEPSYVEVGGTTGYERYQPILQPSKTLETGRNREWDLDYISQRIQTSKSAAIIETDSLNIILSALQRTEGVSIISNPKMIATSGSTNSFFSVGQREPIIETEILRGNPTLGQADLVVARLATGIDTDFIRQGYLQTGIDLRVAATVKTDDYIEAAVRPSIRRLNPQVPYKEVAGNYWPILDVKEIDTTFTLRSGQTVAIGGLTEMRDSKTMTKVPVLGDIPVLGRFFRHERDVRRQVETIIFVTLSVADPDGLLEHAGIPEDARLVHNRQLVERARREAFMRDLMERQDAEDRAREAREAEAEEPVQPEEPEAADEYSPTAPAVRPREDQFSQPVSR